jgi:hypothetical protein
MAAGYELQPEYLYCRYADDGPMFGERLTHPSVRMGKTFPDDGG